LAVTQLAKWKTTAQMIAIAVLFGTGIFGHMLLDRMTGMDEEVIAEIFAGGDDPLGLRLIDLAAQVTWWVGIILLWVAALLTLVTGIDYFRKALPYLREDA
jgi:CDP-diacylglycerol--glycerol-3-phosphate 3-phosphatidyltransferase